MTRPDDTPMPDLRQVRALDRWLDDLAIGAPGDAAPPDGLDPETARAARHLHGLSDAATEAALARSAPSSAWTALLAGVAQTPRAGAEAPVWAAPAWPIARRAKGNGATPSSAPPCRSRSGDPPAARRASFGRRVGAGSGSGRWAGPRRCCWSA